MPYTIQPVSFKYRNGNAFATADCIKGDKGDQGDPATIQTANKTVTNNGITYRFYRSGNVVQTTAHSGTLIEALTAQTNMASIPEGFRPITNTYWHSGEYLFFANQNGLEFHCRSDLPANKTLRFSVTYITGDAFPSS